MNIKIISLDGSGKPEKITKKEAIKLIGNCYQNPEYVLENAERLFNNRIRLRHFEIIIEK